MSTEITIVIAAIAVLVGGFVIWRLLAPAKTSQADASASETPKGEPSRVSAGPPEADIPKPEAPARAEIPPSEDLAATSPESRDAEAPGSVEDSTVAAEASSAGSEAMHGASPPSTEEPPQAERPPADAASPPAASSATEAEEVEGEGAEGRTSSVPPLRSQPPPGEVDAFKKGLQTTRGGFISRLAGLFRRKTTVDPSLLDEIEEVLITADIGVKTADAILSSLRTRLEKGELQDAEAVWDALREHAKTLLSGSRGGVRIAQEPTVILVVGVNGVGKTTTIGKLASRFNDEGRSVLLAAGDTFRAAAVLQLEVWGRRVGCDVHKGRDRADPASVVFEAVKKGIDEGKDVIIADTAGRLHTKANLMEELKKVSRSVEKALGRPADEVLLVLDSTTGQNAIQQAAIFREALDLTGIVLTKLDGTAKGGVILGIVDEHGVPVRYVGMGERVEDLHEFSASPFVAALFSKPDDESAAA